MKIPSTFTINAQTITVEIRDTLHQRFGLYDCISDTITLARNIVDEDGEIRPLTQEQITNTFFHELLHAFQWHTKGETDEQESSLYAGPLVEYLKTKAGEHNTGKQKQDRTDN